MFGISKKKKPKTALDEFIFAAYGNPPPPKTARLGDAIHIAHEELLMGIVTKEDVTELATKLNAGPVPYSTHDLALSVALNFFKQPDLMPHLKEAQMTARLLALEWLTENKVISSLVQSFESVLYKLYKPALEVNSEEVGTTKAAE